MAGEDHDRRPHPPPVGGTDPDLRRRPRLPRDRRLDPLHAPGCAARAQFPPLQLHSGGSQPPPDRQRRLGEHRRRHRDGDRRHQPHRDLPRLQLALLHRHDLLLPCLHHHVPRCQPPAVRADAVLPAVADLLDRGRQQRGDHDLLPRALCLRRREDDRPAARRRGAGHPRRGHRLLHPAQRAAAGPERVRGRDDGPDGCRAPRPRRRQTRGGPRSSSADSSRSRSS